MTDKKFTVYDYAVKDVVFANKDDSIINVIESMLITGHRRIPITDNKTKLVGIITTMDILNAFLRETSLKKKVSEIMTRDVVFCREEEKLSWVIKKFKFSGRGGFPIIDMRNKLVGIITENDIMRIFKDRQYKTKLKNLMTTKPLFLKPTHFLDALKTLINIKYRKLPVVENGKLIGILNDRHCLRFLRDNSFKNNLGVNIKKMMLANPVTLTPDKALDDAIEMMVNYETGAVFIAEKGKLLGVITERDVLEEVS